MNVSGASVIQYANRRGVPLIRDQGVVVDADWVARSTAPSVTRASRLDTALVTFDPGASPGFPPGGQLDWVLGGSGTAFANVSHESTIGTGAGGSTKVAVLASDVATSGEVSFYLGRSFGNGDTMWVSFRLRAPADQAYQPWDAGGVETAHKLCTLGTTNASHNNNTIVLQANYTMGLVSGYFYMGDTGTSDVFDTSFTPAWGADLKWQPEVDNGANPLTGTNPDTGSAWTAQEQGGRQFGGLYTSKVDARTRIGYGYPLAGGVRQIPDEFMTYTMRVVIGAFGSANSRITLWVARNAAGYIRLVDRRNVTLGSIGNPAYDTLKLLPYVTNRLANTGCKVSSRTNNITGAEIYVVGNATPTGVGTLEYVASTGLFRWKGFGESYGTARGFSAANNILVINVCSGTGAQSYVVVHVTPASLPSSGTTTDAVTIATPRPDTAVYYNDAIASTQPINAPGGFAPIDSSATTLGTAAAAMSAGTWLAFTAPAQTAVVGSEPGDAGTLLTYTNKMPWNPISKRIEVLAGDHRGAPPEAKHVAFDAVANTWVLVQDVPAVPGLNHGYDHTEVNPTTGDIYHRLDDSGGSVSIKLYKKTYGGANTFSLVSPAQATWNSTIACGTCWWTGTFTGGSGGGAQGLFMVFNSGAASSPSGSATDGEISAYNPLTGTWVFDSFSMSPFFFVTGNVYHTVMAYSAVKNCAVYGGGNDQPTKLWRLNSDGTVTVMPTVPTGKMVGIQRGTLSCDPVTGNFLLMSFGELWELNPTGSGTWTQQTGSRAVPAGVGHPNETSVGAANWDAVMACEIAEYGVTAYITQTTSPSKSTFYLYKHA